MDRLYRSLRKQKVPTGRAFIRTPGNHIVEAGFYESVIVHLKSTLPHEACVKTVLDNEIGELSISPWDMGLTGLQPATVEKTFLSAAPYIFDTKEVSPDLPFALLDIMGRLGRSGEAGAGAFDVMAHVLSQQYPDFSVSSEIIEERLTAFQRRFDIQADLLAGFVPSNGYSTVGWLLDALAPLGETLMSKALRHFVFFGELQIPLYSTVAAKESGLGARGGFARLSKKAYEPHTGRTTVLLFRGEKEAGQLQINWHSDKRPDVLLTKGDMEKLNLRDTDRLNIIFAK